MIPLRDQIANETHARYGDLAITINAYVEVLVNVIDKRLQELEKHMKEHCFCYECRQETGDDNDQGR